jgi:predicted nuclease with TOPRIM domain
METKEIRDKIKKHEEELKKAQESLQRINQQQAQAVAVIQRLAGAVAALNDLLPKNDKPKKP